MVLSVERQMKDLLAARGVVVGTWQMFVGKMPALPDTAIAVNKGVGRAGHVKLLVDFPGIQIMVRGGKTGEAYEAAEAKIRECRDIILGIDSKPAEFLTLTSVTERGHISFIGYDESDRPMFSSNYQLIVEPQPSPKSNRVSL